MYEVSKVIFVYFLSLMVMIKSRYLLIEIDQEALASSVEPQRREAGKFSVNWQTNVFY